MRQELVLIVLSSVLLVAASAPLGSQVLGLDPSGVLFADGSVLSSAAGSWANVRIVAKTGGHFSSIQAALDSILDASELNPYLVWVAPGVYEEQVKMKSWVDVQGSGETVTRITAIGYVGLPDDDYATLVGADHSALRHLTVEKSGPAGSIAFAVSNNTGCSRLTHVTAIASGGPENIAVSGYECSAPLRHVTAISREPVAGPPLSTGTNLALLLGGDGVTPLVLEHVRATASGGLGGHATGIVISNTFEMRDVTATASGGGTNWGIDIRGTGVSTDVPEQFLTDVTAVAKGGTTSHGIEVWGYTSPQMANVSSTGQEASSENVGCYLKPNATALIEHSRLAGDENKGLLLEDVSAHVWVAYSRVQGGSGGATENCHCLGAYSTPTCTLDLHCKLPSDVIC